MQARNVCLAPPAETDHGARRVSTRPIWQMTYVSEPFDKRDLDTVSPMLDRSVLRSLLYVPDQTHALARGW
jgi:hypothetical protein